MGLRWCACLLVALSSFSAWAGSNSKAAAHRGNTALRMPITTASRPAHVHFDAAMRDMEEVRMGDTVDQLRAAIKDDPQFAQAWVLLSYLSRDPEEQESARARAERLASHGTRAERLLIQWLTSAAEDHYVPAIAAMNDLLALYPKDQQLLYLAGGWLSRQGRYAQSNMILERALTLDPDYAAALNELAYGYAFTGDFPRAFTLMAHYVALQPDQPNPHDSYGEILRMAGKFDAALEQYRASIHCDPMFGSELGVADTYALMGREQDARDEYDRAIVFANSDQERVEYELNSAITWIRENNRKQAEHAIRDVARHAHRAGLGRLEAESHRILAMYEPEYKSSIRELDAAQKALDEPHQISPTVRAEEHARILMVRAVEASQAHSMEAGEAASQELAKMAAQSRSQVIQLAYHTASGAVWMAQGKDVEAVPELQEDFDNPLAMRMLWHAYTNLGRTKDAAELAAKLSALNVPTAEQALVVSQFRANLVTEAKQP
jgi:tetratricopeptide (TPR) repeat protein